MGCQARKSSLHQILSFSESSFGLQEGTAMLGGKVTIRLPESHRNQPQWSTNDQQWFEDVRQFLLELPRSFDPQADTALPLVDNLTWSRHDGSALY